MSYIGDYKASTTVTFTLTTHAADGSAVAPSSALEAADLIVYKGSSATQRTSANGITMTSPFDSIVGLHMVSIDLSDNTDAGFWAAGNDYHVILSPDETVDSKTVVREVAFFSIENRCVNWAQVVSPTTTVGLSGTTVKTATDVETDTADIQTRIPAALSSGNMKCDVLAISTDTVAADNAEAFFDGTGYAGTNNVIPLVTTTTTATNVTTVNGLAANVITAASVAADAGTEIGAAVLSALGTGTWATAIPWNAAWDAEVQSEVNDELILQNLDHLVKSAVDTDFATTVHVDSVIGQLAQTADGGYARATDSLEAQADAAAGTTAVNVVVPLATLQNLQTPSTITIHKYSSLSFSLTAMGSVANKSKVWFTVKDEYSDTDAQAIIQITEAGGLVYLEGASYGTSAHGSITWTDTSAGDVTIAMDEVATALLTSRKGLKWDLKVLRSTNAVNLLATGTLDILDGVTRTYV